ncbi:MAG: glycine cleavage system aminomethyltransferase GcvT [Acidobacteriota bacterium]
MTAPRLLPLHDRHQSIGARFMEFAGWQMPLQYSGILAEHGAVRQAAGLFDVTHMGKLCVQGPSAGEFLQRMTMNDILALEDGKAQYSGLLTAQGTLLDDLIVYRVGNADYRLVVNASRVSIAFEWLRERACGAVEVTDRSAEMALLAIQGPEAASILAKVCTESLALRPFRHAVLRVAGVDSRVARTGYTGEDGFEIFVPADAATTVWDGLLEAGREDGLRPAGLGARETLRLEAGLLLYGQDIDETTTPLEAALDRFVALDKGEFIGREVLLRQRQGGLTRRLRGFEMEEAGIARTGYGVWAGEKRVGTVTSGGFAPTLRKSVGLVYLPCGMRERTIQVEIRARRAAAHLMSLPFYRRKISQARLG